MSPSHPTTRPYLPASYAQRCSWPLSHRNRLDFNPQPIPLSCPVLRITTSFLFALLGRRYLCQLLHSFYIIFLCCLSFYLATDWFYCLLYFRCTDFVVIFLIYAADNGLLFLSDRPVLPVVTGLYLVRCLLAMIFSVNTRRVSETCILSFTYRE